MTAKAYRFEVTEARSFRHPVFSPVVKTIFILQASKLPRNLPDGANAREPVGMNRRVYRDVTESLKGNDALPGSFDLMNLGITILADKVDPIDKKTFDVMIRDEDGIVNGSHTAKIIGKCHEDGSIPDEQFVEVRIITGIRLTEHGDLKADIAKGQNSGIAVQDHSIYETQGLFESIKRQIRDEEWGADVAWRESDEADVDVRDLIAVMEAINVIDFPRSSATHPVSAYEKWSTPLKKFFDDTQENLGTPSRRKYAALEPLLVEAMELYDRIRHDFRPTLNKEISASAGRMRIVEEAPKRLGDFKFPASKQPPEPYRLTKGAAFPILAAFRTCVQYDPEQNAATWLGGFGAVRKVWEEARSELVRETYNATKDISNTPNVLGKHRGHWSNLYRLVQVRVLEKQLEQQQT